TGVDLREVDAAIQAVAELEAGIGRQPVVFLHGVLAESVLARAGDADMGVGAAAHAASGQLRASGAEAAGLQAQDGAGRIASGARNEVDGTAERCRAGLERVGAAPDLDVARRQRLDRLEVEAAVGEVEWHAVLEHDKAAAVEGALQP